MTNTKFFNSVVILVVTGLILILGTSCQKEEVPARETIYVLNVEDVLGVTGMATFTENDNSVTIDLVLFGAPSGDHPAELRRNTFAEGGELILNLNPVNESGRSSTLITSMNYNQLTAFDGFIKIMKSVNEPQIILAQGDIGGNALTETKISYTLNTIEPFGVNGTALFQKRKNGNTLVTIKLTGTIDGEEYPASINLSSVATIGGGPVSKTLNVVKGSTGNSFTTIRKLNSGLDITYDNWMVYNGYINIYQMSPNYENIICQGNIGSNVN